ncbi:PREDICTED: dehydrodolichyl diphosphate syntase complex subunit Nus1 isoform X2 [Dinoponera quadriceps]|uniref:ditrans,polycis-polyprenyl diphosphate synthase [(2E,6E)-farnesyldiphosphate specific] n=1 Tax=Dinoponera quadriceps TaxID=609295 RepID=A0A6P3Y4M6_DINQU|nr:PREDICTED: dehydrodolichyl diphosphate syntase complex subunit Nus1 isoform X2 [Dinoponera quadriceps]
MYTLLRALLVLVHRLYIGFCYAWAALQRVYADLWCAASSTTELDTIVRTLARAKKMPRHLVIVQVIDQSLLDCVRIIGWCITLDIPYISFFDRNGFFKRNESNLKEQFAKKWPDLVEYITWNSYTKAPSQNGITNDGKGKIVTLTQSLAKAVSTGKLDPEEITDQLITEKLQVKGMPDPDLALIYGYSCSTHGLLPWHTRTTEFLMLPLYVRITVKDFAYVLERYSKCVQRYGK